MTRPGIQLYTLRDIDEPLPDIIERIATIGFEGVEFANRFHDADLDAVAAVLSKTGIEPIGGHVGLGELERDMDAYVERYEAVGCRSIVIAHPSTSHFRSEQRVRNFATRLNTVGEALDDRGFDLLYHNQAHDFLPLSNRTPFSRFLVHDVSQQPLTGFEFERRARALGSRMTDISEALDDRVFRIIEQYRSRDPVPIIGGTAFGRLVTATDPDLVSFELDIGAVTAAGYDPVDVLDRLDGRVPQIHMKDVAVEHAIPGSGQTSVEPGRGNVDFERATTAARRIGTTWLIYEHDNPDDPIVSADNGMRLLEPFLDK